MSREPGFLGWSIGPLLTAAVVLVVIVIGGRDDDAREPPPWARPGASEGAVIDRRSGRGTVIGRGASEAGGNRGAASEAGACSRVAVASQPPAAADGRSRPAGADLIGGGGALDASDAAAVTVGCARLDGLDLASATALAVDGDGGVWVLLPGVGEAGPPRRLGFGSSRVLRADDGQIDVVRDIGGPAWLTTGPDGEVHVVARGEEAVSVLGTDAAQDREIDVELVGAVFGLALMEEGGVLVAGRRAVELVGSDGDADGEIPLDDTGARSPRSWCCPATAWRS